MGRTTSKVRIVKENGTKIAIMKKRSHCQTCDRLWHFRPGPVLTRRAVTIFHQDNRQLAVCGWCFRFLQEYPSFATQRNALQIP